MVFRYIQYLWQEMSCRGRKTFQYDLFRGATDGALISAYVVFGLLIAIEHFQASTLQKSLIAAGHPMGMILSIFYAAWSPRLGNKPLRGGLPFLAGVIGMLIAAAAQDAWTFTFGLVLAGATSRMPLPILTGIYRDNYRDSVRGQAFGITVMLSIIAALLMNLFGGKILDSSLEYYRYLYCFLAFLYVVSAVSVFRMPRSKTPEPVMRNPLNNFSAIRDNPLFGYVLSIWFLFGIVNLALIPQRVERLTDPRYGFELSPFQVALILGVTVEGMRLIMIQVWARLFDRFNFIYLRMILCSLFLVYMLLFFNSDSLLFTVIGAISLGAAFAGGAIAWNLWVTKFAPAHQTSQYMAVHAFLTGVRGTLGPYLGYLLVESIGMEATSWISASITAAAILLLWPIRKMALLTADRRKSACCEPQESVG